MPVLRPQQCARRASQDAQNPSAWRGASQTERRTFSCFDLAMSSSMSSLRDLGLAASWPGCWEVFSRGSAPPPKWAAVSSAADRAEAELWGRPCPQSAHTWDQLDEALVA